MNNKIRLATLFISAFLLTSCASAPPQKEILTQVTTNDVESSTDTERLWQVMTQLDTQLTNKDSTLYAADFSLLRQIKTKFVDLKTSSITTKLSDQRLPQPIGVIPLNLLDDNRNVGDATPSIQHSSWNSLSLFLTKENRKTSEAISKRSTTLGQLDDQTKLTHLKELAKISGQQRWKDKEALFIDELISEIKTLSANGAFESNDSFDIKIAIVQQERSGNRELMDELIHIKTRLFEKRFFGALAEGSPDKAYDIFIAVSGTDDFEQVKAILKDISQKISVYFVALADESVADIHNVTQSYRWYQQAKQINKILGLGAIKSQGLNTVIEQLYTLQEKANQSELPALSLAYLSAIQDMGGINPKVRREIRETMDVVRKTAIKKATTTSFSGTSATHDYGNVVSSEITQYMFKHMPNDVKIIEREQYEAILREQTIGGTQQDLVAVDYLITGSVLESTVDTVNTIGKKTLRVTLGSKTVANPAYIKWLELKQDERENAVRPVETIQIKDEENVAVAITKHRKVGIFSVSYRLVEAKTGKILFPDSFTLKEEYSDTSSEGIEMGDFVLPFKLAELPSDIEILDKLAKKISMQIGESLTEKLNNYELRYIKQADSHLAENNCIDETSSLASALIIMDLKDQDQTDVKKRFIQSALKCSTVI